jgi:hypothetical protein
MSNINTYILATHMTLQTVDHADLRLLEESLTRHGATCVVLPQTVIARMTASQYAMFTMEDAPMSNDANALCLKTYTN